MGGHPTQLGAAYHELSRYLAVLDAAPGGRDWLEGTFSLADIVCTPHFWMMAEGEPALDLASTPHVSAWLKRLWNRPAWGKVVEATPSGDV